MEKVDIDRLVDYKAEYSAVLEKVKISGRQMTGCCPFHHEKNPSFSVNLEDGRYCCFACGAKGNFLDFYQKINGLADTKEAYRAVLKKYGVEDETSLRKAARRELATYTVADYAARKMLPAETLRDVWGLTNARDKDGTPYVRVPYYSADGKEVIFRKRYKEDHNPRFRWGYGASGKLMLYGLRYLEGIKETGEVVLVEGESDTQSLWMMDIPALGVPGASVFCERMAAPILDIPAIYLHIEPDDGGKTFLAKVCEVLCAAGYTGTVRRISCSDLNVKDPSELWMRSGEAAKDKVRGLMDAAEAVDIEMQGVPETLPDAPARLKIPEGYELTAEGVKAHDTKADMWRIICRTPLLITGRMKSVTDGFEKVEVAWRRDNAWERGIYPRSVIFQARSITVLSDRGCTITSENAKQVVRYLAALEEANMDRIPLRRSTQALGWQSGGEFLPGHAPSITLDVDPSMQGWVDAYHARGSLEDWVALISKYRGKSAAQGGAMSPEAARLRFIVASSLAAPLLKIIGGRSFVVYNWANSKSGKTAALKAALSVWGEPEGLMTSFNATQVALEHKAALYCDLPLGIDERQLAGNNQSLLDRIVFMLSEGKSRSRGKKDGGLQAMQSWRCIALATGEEPLLATNSPTGTGSRVVEIYGPPFRSEADAGRMHRALSEAYGTAGQVYMERVIALGARNLRVLYEQRREGVRLASLACEYKADDGAHMDYIALVALAECLAGEWLFGLSAADAECDADEMAMHILDDDAGNSLRDVNEEALQFVVDWVRGNADRFNREFDGIAEMYGWLEGGGNTYAIYPSRLDTTLKSAGYSGRKLLKYMAERGVIETSVEGGRLRYTAHSTQKDKSGARPRMVMLDLNRAVGVLEGVSVVPGGDVHRQPGGGDLGGKKAENPSHFDVPLPRENAAPRGAGDLSTWTEEVPDGEQIPF